MFFVIKKFWIGTVSMRGNLTISHSIKFNRELPKLKGFTQTEYPVGKHNSGRPYLMMPLVEMHSKGIV